MRSFAAASAIFLLGIAACARPHPVQSFQVLGNTTAGIQAAFNADAGKVRVLMLVSPVCGVCLRGASEVSEQLSKDELSKNAAIYVVWVPRLGAREKNVPAATRVVAVPWALQYWDGNDLLGVQYKQVLGWSDNAWDVYMLYGPKARWTAPLPPAPDFYMHQTDEKGPRLNAEIFGARVKQLL